MKLFDAYISDLAFSFFKNNKESLTSSIEANKLLQNECGVKDFFLSDSELLQLFEELSKTYPYLACESNAEYGDFQTNQKLASQITEKLAGEGISPKVVIEPTCGKGHFILAALDTFSDIEKIMGIEIQKKHIW